MPSILVQSNAVLTGEAGQQLLASLSQAVAETIGKPERYVLASLAPASLLMSGQAGPAAWVEVRSIGGLTAEVNGRLAERICNLLARAANIKGDRVYLNFMDVPAPNWGWNGETFG